jgi:uncharacterized protein (DUF433 family)
VTLPDFLTEWPGGEIVLTGHRIGLYSVVNCYNEGYSPEMIVCEFPTLPLALVYRVIAFYLENQTEVDKYVAETQAEIDRQRAAGKHPDWKALRERLEAMRRAETKPGGTGA